MSLITKGKSRTGRKCPLAVGFILMAIEFVAIYRIVKNAFCMLGRRAVAGTPQAVDC